MASESWRMFQDMEYVPLPMPPSKEEANGVQTGRGRAGNSPLGFHVEVSVPPPSGNSRLVKSKGRGGFWGRATLCPKVVTDEGQRARAFAKSGLGCWLFSPWLELGQLTL